jgi:hypothetical protein
MRAISLCLLSRDVHKVGRASEAAEKVSLVILSEAKNLSVD